MNEVAEEVTAETAENAVEVALCVLHELINQLDKVTQVLAAALPTAA